MICNNNYFGRIHIVENVLVPALKILTLPIAITLVAIECCCCPEKPRKKLVKVKTFPDVKELTPEEERLKQKMLETARGILKTSQESDKFHI